MVRVFGASLTLAVHCFVLGVLPRARSGRCYAVAPGATPFCGTGYDVHDINATATDAMARQLYDRYAMLNVEQSCQQIYKEFVCAAHFPACVPSPTPAGKPGSVLACREHCVYARLCGYPTVRGLQCKTLNSAHEKGFMIRQPMETVFGETGSGKSTIARALEEKLVLEMGLHVQNLDGDNVRTGLNRDLGFSPEDRAESVRRVGEMACLFNAGGVITLVTLVSPYQADRDAARVHLFRR